MKQCDEEYQEGQSPRDTREKVPQFPDFKTTSLTYKRGMWVKTFEIHDKRSFDQFFKE